MAGRKREYWNPLLRNYVDSQKVNSVSVGAETLFTRLIAKCDDYANFDGSPMLLMCKLYSERVDKGQVTVDLIKQWRDEIITARLVSLYVVENREYIHVNDCYKCLRNDVKREIGFPSFTKSNVVNIDGETLPKPKPKTEQNSNESDTEMSQFDEARKLFPGKKRGLDTEFKNLKKKHKDWKNVIPLLKPAIEREIAHKESLKASNEFCPQWKGFQRWINERCWEEEYADVDSSVDDILGKKRVTQSEVEQLEKDLGL